MNQSMSDYPLVSIIIPVYNIERYVGFCLWSALNQTYKKIEVIAINDGSTDGSRDTCADFASSYPMLSLVDKHNGGLSSARNEGMKLASGDYILFLDGDDYLALNAVEELVALAMRYKIQIVSCPLKKVSESNSYRVADVQDYAIKTGFELFKDFLYLDGEAGSACGKLIDRALLVGLEFPNGQLFEDIGIMAELFCRTERACVLKSALYAYRTRSDSITTSRRYGVKHIVDMEDSLEMVRSCIGTDSCFKNAYKCFSAFCRLRVAMRLKPSCERDIEMRSLMLDYIDYARCCAFAACGQKSVSKIWRARCFLFAKSPSVHNSLYNAFSKLTDKVAPV